LPASRLPGVPGRGRGNSPPVLTRVIAVLTGGVLALGLLGAPSASNGAEAHRHKKKPTVTYTLASADLDQRTQGAAGTYKVQRLPKRGSVVLQSHSEYEPGWADLAVGTTKRGTLQGAPWPQLGQYAVRVVVRDGKGKKVARAPRSTVRAFGIIPLENFARSTYVGTVTIGGQTFPYTSRMAAGTLFDFPGGTSCSAFSITVGSPNNAFRVLRPGYPSVDVAADTLQTVDTFAKPGDRFYYALAPVGGGLEYANGSAYCYTLKGTVVP
jgi:hypothetical protein